MNEQIKNKLKSFVDIFIISILCGFILSLVRAQESYFLESALYTKFEAFKLLPNSCFIDLKAAIIFSVLLFPLVFLVRDIKKSATVFFVFFIVINSLLTKYFLINFDLLGDEVLNFSLSEIFYIVETEKGSVPVFEIFMFIFYPLFFILLVYCFSKISYVLGKNSQAVLLLIYFGFLIGSAVDYKYYLPNFSSFSSYQKFILSNNKPSYFVAEIVKRKLEDKTLAPEEHLDKNIAFYQSTNPQFSYPSKIYPLVHNEEYTNILGPFFEHKNIKPNIVFILVESLSRSFSGPNAHLGSFTPFLDSLRNKSLYWENFLSNADRTYGVLPNVLSSAPFLDQFVSNNNYIKHSSIISELKSEDYSTSFSYGGWSNFTSMDVFLKSSKIDTIYADYSFDTSVFKIHQATENDFHWGYDDKALFEQYLLHNKDMKEPFFSAMLTLSMHSPFDVNPDYTIKDAKKHLGNKLTDYQKELIKVHPEKITSIAFTDQSLQAFFKAFKQKESFKNTIFVITGDHNIQSLPLRNELDLFHVPLIIYSDLLVRPKSFKGVSTHREITPSILGLLENNFGLQFQKDKPWLGYALDTSANFTSKINTPMVLTFTKYVRYLYQNQVVFKDEVYQFDSLLNMTKQTDTAISNKVMKIYNDYKNIEQYIYKNNSLMK